MSVPPEIEHLDFDPFADAMAARMGNLRGVYVEFDEAMRRIQRTLEVHAEALGRLGITSQRFRRLAARREQRAARERRRRRAQCGQPRRKGGAR